MYEPLLMQTVAFGPNQFAYTKGRGSRDAIAFLTLTWLMGFDDKNKFAVFCSDVSAAFDRVRQDTMENKLKAKGLHPRVCHVLSSWLALRTATVVVAGAASRSWNLQDMVYQGTALGPQLWNIFFEDAAYAVRSHGFNEIIYADDLNAYRAYPLKTPNAAIKEASRRCQGGLHTWAVPNQVTFDAAKESHHILSRTPDAEGGSFRILGALFDCKLIMNEAVHELVVAAKWKIQTILRTRHFMDTDSLVLAYKSQVLYFLEHRTGAI